MKGTARRRASKRRADVARQRVVAAEVEARDRICRVFSATDKIPALGPCWGRSAAMHLGEKRRCFTMGMLPEQRHDRTWEAWGCSGHHTAYDLHQFDLEPLDPSRGADGDLLLTYDGETVVV